MIAVIAKVQFSMCWAAKSQPPTIPFIVDWGNRKPFARANLPRLPIQFRISLTGKFSSSKIVSMREGLGELLLQPRINHFSNGPSLLASATHVFCAGHYPSHLRLARG